MPKQSLKLPLQGSEIGKTGESSPKKVTVQISGSNITLVAIKNAVMSGEEENIYMNPYPATREFGWRVKYILLKWKGSVFRLMWKELAIYMSLYFFISLTYRLLLAQYPTAKHNFELFCVHCSFHIHPTAVAILTGFYVSNVVHRYWEQFMAIPWPDQLALKLVAFIPCEVCVVLISILI